MAGEELFGVVVRTIGLLLFLYGFWNFSWGIGALKGGSQTENSESAEAYLGFGAVAMGVGAALAFGANVVVQMLY